MESTAQISFKDSMSKSWQMLVDNWILLFGITFATMISAIAIAALVIAITIDSPHSALLVIIAILIWSAYSNTFIFKLVLRLVRGQSTSFRDCLPSIKQIKNWTLSWVIVELQIVAGLLLLIIPGLYLMATIYPFYSYAVVDGQNPIKAIETSHKISKGRFWQILSFLAALSLLSFTVFTEAMGLFIWIFATILFAFIYNQSVLKEVSLND